LPVNPECADLAIEIPLQHLFAIALKAADKQPETATYHANYVHWSSYSGLIEESSDQLGMFTSSSNNEAQIGMAICSYRGSR
jgi:hypothetical protein